jgi:hypothetical protein
VGLATAAKAPAVVSADVKPSAPPSKKTTGGGLFDELPF